MFVCILGGDDPINIHDRTFIYRSAYAQTEYLRDSVGPGCWSGTCRKSNVLIQV